MDEKGSGVKGRRGEEQPGGTESPSGAQFAGLGIQFALSILIFLYAGKWLDGRLGTAPLFLIAGVFVGAGGAFYNMYRKLMKGPKA